MENGKTHPSIESSGLDSNPTLNVLIVYEDFAAGKHAKRMYDRLTEHLGRSTRSVCQMWKFDVLTVPKLKEMAARDAVEADVIIVSVCGANQLPSEVREWFELWLAEDCHAIAFVALSCECQLEEWNTVRSELNEVARRGRIKFFSQPGPIGWETGDLVLTIRGSREGVGNELTAVAQDFPDSAPVARWEMDE